MAKMAILTQNIAIRAKKCLQNGLSRKPPNRYKVKKIFFGHGGFKTEAKS
jgi:hypothetical protein